MIACWTRRADCGCDWLAQRGILTFGLDILEGSGVERRDGREVRQGRGLAVWMFRYLDRCWRFWMEDVLMVGYRVGCGMAVEGS